MRLYTGAHVLSRYGLAVIDPCILPGSSRSLTRPWLVPYVPSLKREDTQRPSICESVLYWSLLLRLMSRPFSLASFGGAGGQHACEIAQLLGIKTILIHSYSSILSAYGLALADRCAYSPTSTALD